MRNRIASTSLRVLVSSALVLGMVPAPALAEGIEEAQGAVQALSASTYYIVSPTECGTCWWSIDSEGTLLVSAMGGYDYGTLPQIPWNDYCTKVTSVKFQGTVRPEESACLFSGMTNLKSVDFTGLDLSGVTDIDSMFLCCTSLEAVDFTGLDTSTITSMHGLFASCPSLTSVKWGGINTSNVTNMSGLFNACSSLSSIDMSELDTSSVTDMSSMFAGCTSLRSFDFSDLDTSSAENFRDMFNNCKSLASVSFTGLDASNLINTSGMFSNCDSLTSVDFSGLKTPNLKFMRGMFESCDSLTSARIADLDTTSLINFSWLFWGCKSLIEVDLSGLDTSNVSVMDSSFSGCDSLSKLKVGEGFSFAGNGEGQRLSLPGDYWLSSADGNTYAGDSIPNFVEATYTLLQPITEEMFTVDTRDEAWTGSPITKAIVANDLTEGVDYQVSYSGNISRGFATITISGLGDYSGTLTYQFQIRDADYSCSLDDESLSVPFETTAASKVTWSVEDASVAWISSIEESSVSMGAYGRYMATIGLTPEAVGVTRLNGYIGDAEDPAYSYLIQVTPSTKVDITGAQVTVAGGNTYNGSAITPQTTVKVGEKTLAEGVDYDVAYSNNVNVGTATATVTGKGNYKGSAKATFSIKAADASKATVEIASQAYTGKALTPAPTVTLNGKTLKQGTDYTVSYSNNTNAGTATATVTFKGNYSGTAKGTFKIASASVSYQAHVQNIGWQAAVKDGATAGTSGQSLRVEALKVSVAGAGCDGAIQIRAHVQDIGWQNWSTTGGTTGQSKRVEAMQLRLTGELANRYDVYYRVHAQNYGWMGWAKNGASAGTEGYSLRLEAIQVKLVPKGGAAPGSTADAFRKPAATVEYQAHVQNIGWQAAVKDGATAGTSGQSLRVEALKVSVAGAGCDGAIQIRAHVQDIGWQNWSTTGGTTGQSKRVEAMQLRLTGELANRYDVYYRVHAQNYGWMGWAKNGASAGTEGYSLRLEAIQVKLVPKGGAAPGSTADAFRKPAATVEYQAHVQNIGWQAAVKDGATAGTSGQSLRVEALRVSLAHADYSGGVQIRAHVQDIGWQGWSTTGGTTGQSKRVEAMQIRLTGEMANHYDVYYRVHAQNIGWMGWAKNGEQAGTEGMSLRLEAIQVKLVPKGSAAPGSTANRFKSR